MAVQMTKIKCPMKEQCKFRDGCMVNKFPSEGATFSPVLKLRLENLEWKVKCFSFVKENKGIFHD